MRKHIIRITSLVLCFVLSVSIFGSFSFSTSAASESSLRNDIAALKAESARIEKKISQLKSQKADQSAVLSAIQQKIANTQAQVSRCNQEISSINSKISAIKADIKKQNEEIDNSKLSFKKRLRAIYMSNTRSNIQVLLGAENFSDFLQLSQLTSSISSHDRKMIEDMVSKIKSLEKKNQENEKLLQSQVEVRATVLEAQQQLQQEENEAQSIYNNISSVQKQAEKDNAEVEATIKQKTAYLNQILASSAAQTFVNSKVGFAWPVPSTQNITSYYGPRWGTMHNGIDISSGSIFGKPIVAITDGIVYRTYNGCPHTTKSSRCRCGSGWGNHVAIDHGTVKGQHIKAMYAHMNTIAVGNGAHVTKGQVIGYVGTTGDSTGYHLHFGIMNGNSWVNPLNYY